MRNALNSDQYGIGDVSLCILSIEWKENSDNEMIMKIIHGVGHRTIELVLNDLELNDMDVLKDPADHKEYYFVIRSFDIIL